MTDSSAGIPHGKAVMNYPGAKARLAPWIIDHLPAHNTFVEVFGGSAAVLVHKPESINEVYNDVDDDLVEFFEVLRDRRSELLDWLRGTPYSRSIYNRFADAYHAGERADDPVVRANSGLEADAVIDTAPDAALVHPDCWSKMIAEQRRAENRTLNDYDR